MEEILYLTLEKMNLIHRSTERLGHLLTATQLAGAEAGFEPRQLQVAHTELLLVSKDVVRKPPVGLTHP